MLAATAMAAAVVAMAPVSARAETRVVEEKESQYNHIFIYKRDQYVSLIFGHNRRLYTESLANTKDPLELPVEYTRYMTVAMAYAPAARRLLEIGLGGGTTVSYLNRTYPALKIDAVELDPVVATFARKYFYLKENANLKVIVRDGRVFLVRSQDTYDVIMIDAYRGPFVPFHLLTREFYQLVKKRLAKGGVVAQNIEPSTMLYEAAVATIAAEFDNVEIYPASGNFVLIAYNGPRRTDEDLRAVAGQIDAEYKPRYPLSKIVTERRKPAKTDGQKLTDDFAPVQMLKSIERHNKKRP
ncbi:MAG: fused MFS/spermidine synthase [Bauldia litoralis]